MSAAAPVLLFGASSATGRVLLQRLAAAGPVVAVSRRVHAERAGVRWIQADLASFRWPAGPPPALICSLGPLPDFAAWLAAQALPPLRVVALSSSSATLKGNSADAGERALAERLQAAERQLAHSSARQGQRATILRPTLIWGGGSCALSSAARFARRWRCLPRPWSSGGQRAPLHHADLAAAIHAAASLPAAPRLELGGGEALSIATMLDRVAHSVGARSLPLPGLLLRAGTRLARRSGLQFGAGMLARWQADQRVVDDPSWSLLQLRPRSFAPSVGDWLLPHD